MSQGEEDRSWSEGLDPDRAVEDLREALERARGKIEDFRRKMARRPEGKEGGE